MNFVQFPFSYHGHTYNSYDEMAAGALQEMAAGVAATFDAKNGAALNSGFNREHNGEDLLLFALISARKDGKEINISFSSGAV